MLTTLFGAVLSYLLGAVPIAYLFVKAIKGIDIREYGSGNVGATNALRVLGKMPGFLVLFLDILKGFLAVTLLGHIFLKFSGMSPEIIRPVFGLAVVSGHVFNVFLKFKGGRGVSTSLGVLLGVAPESALIGIVIFLITVTLTKYVSLGSILAGIIIPFHMLITKCAHTYIVLSSLLCIIIVIKHKANIKRLITGRERKIFKK